MPAFGNAYATSSTEIGLAIELTRHTAVPPAYWFKVKNPKYKPDLTVIEDTTLQGSMVQVYDQVPGLRYDSHGWDGSLYLDAFPILLRALLGSTDTLVTAPGNTTLAAAYTAGGATISTTATLAAGSWFMVGSGETTEVRQVKTVTGTGPFVVTPNYPFEFNHANAAAVTGLTGHKIGLLNNAAGTGNQPPSVTISDFDGEEWRQITGAQLDKLTIKGNATGLAEYTCSWFGDAATTPGAPSASFTTFSAAPGWALQVMIGTTQIGYMVDWEFELSRGVKPIPALTGSQAYFNYFAGPLQATAKITVVEQSGAPELSAYVNGTQQAFELMLSNLNTGSALLLHSSNAAFKSGELDRSKEWVQAPIGIQLLPTATDAPAGGVSPLITQTANAILTPY